MVVCEMVSSFYDWSYHACIECFQCCLLRSPILQLSHFFYSRCCLVDEVGDVWFQVHHSSVVPSSTAES